LESRKNEENISGLNILISIASFQIRTFIWNKTLNYPTGLKFWSYPIALKFWRKISIRLNFCYIITMRPKFLLDNTSPSTRALAQTRIFKDILLMYLINKNTYVKLYVFSLFIFYKIDIIDTF
jgi:hypothetical protein